MNYPKVIIDGVEYIPNDTKTIEVHGHMYPSVKNWLFNVRGELLHQFMNAAKDGHDPYCDEAQAVSKKIDEFDRFVDEYLGFEKSDNHQEYYLRDKVTE